MLCCRPYCQHFHEGAVSYKSNPFIGKITHTNNSSLIWVRKSQSPSGHVPNHYTTANYNNSTWKYMMFWHMLTTAVVFLTLLVENWHKIGDSFEKGSVYKKIHCQWSKTEFLIPINRLPLSAEHILTVAQAEGKTAYKTSKVTGHTTERIVLTGSKPHTDIWKFRELLIIQHWNI